MSINRSIQSILFARRKPEPIRQSLLLSLLASSLDSGDSIADVLSNPDGDAQGRWFELVEQLRRLLMLGNSLGSAVALCEGLLPDQTVIAIQVAEEAGTMKETLEYESQRLMEFGMDSTGRATGADILVWVTAIATVALLLLSFLMIFIIPKFKHIFDDFGVKLPTATIVLINISDWFLNYSALLALPALVVGLTLVFLYQRSLYASVSLGRHPGWKHFCFRWKNCLLHQLSVSVAAGMPTREVFQVFLKLVPQGSARSSMGTAGQLSESGLSLGPSLQRAGFISRRESDFLTAAETSGHLDWALLHTGRNLSRGFPRILDWCISVLPALLLAATATAVGFFVYAMFIPLVSLLESLAVTGTFFN